MNEPHQVLLRFCRQTDTVVAGLAGQCGAGPLCDLALVGRTGPPVLLHRLVLARAAPSLAGLLGEQSNATLLLPDTDRETLELCRARLYSGNCEPIRQILGLAENNTAGKIKSENNAEAEAESKASLMMGGFDSVNLEEGCDETTEVTTSMDEERIQLVSEEYQKFTNDTTIPENVQVSDSLSVHIEPAVVPGELKRPGRSEKAKQHAASSIRRYFRTLIEHIRDWPLVERRKILKICETRKLERGKGNICIAFYPTPKK